MGLKIMIKQLLLIPIAVLFISVNGLALSEEECGTGGGEWILPPNIDPREGDQRPPYCQCQQGYKWDGTACLPISAEILCENSDGVWAKGSCECPEESSGWNDKVGCDYTADIESEVVTPADSKVKYTSVIVLLILLLSLILIYFITRKKKKPLGDLHEE